MKHIILFMRDAGIAFVMAWAIAMLCNMGHFGLVVVWGVVGLMVSAERLLGGGKWTEC